LNAEVARRHRLVNTLQSVLLIGAMAGLLALLGWIVADLEGLLVALVVGLLVALFGPRVSPWLVLRMYRAQAIHPRQAPDLYRALYELCRRADLSRPPALFYIPTPMLNAFAVGSRDQAAIVLTDGLLRKLDGRELVGVLAHELSHVRHNDMWVMNLADIISRMTVALSQVGLFLLLLGLPLLLLGIIRISPVALLLLIFAPTLVALLQLALSRTREYEADRGAVELTGDPRGLASALQKLEHYQGGWLERILMPGRREPDPAILRTHPATSDRIRRLRELAPPEAPPLRIASYAPPARAGRRPRWHLNGLWY
jgi:heat shock protein HtpX